MSSRSESRPPAWAWDSCKTPQYVSQSGFGEITLLTRMIPEAAGFSHLHLRNRPETQF